MRKRERNRKLFCCYKQKPLTLVYRHEREKTLQSRRFTFEEKVSGEVTQKNRLMFDIFCENFFDCLLTLGTNLLMSESTRMQCLTLSNFLERFQYFRALSLGRHLLHLLHSNTERFSRKFYLKFHKLSTTSIAGTRNFLQFLKHVR